MLNVVIIRVTCVHIQFIPLHAKCRKTQKYAMDDDFLVILQTMMRLTETDSSMSRLLSIAWLMCRMIQSNRAPYKDFAMESRTVGALTHRHKKKTKLNISLEL